LFLLNHVKDPVDIFTYAIDAFPNYIYWVALEALNESLSNNELAIYILVFVLSVQSWGAPRGL